MKISSHESEHWKVAENEEEEEETSTVMQTFRLLRCPSVSYLDLQWLTLRSITTYCLGEQFVTKACSLRIFLPTPSLSWI